MLASRPTRLALVILFTGMLIACGGDDDTNDSDLPGPVPTATSIPPTTAVGGSNPSEKVINITVRGGSVEGPSRQQVVLNQRVVLRVTSDVADEIHVHGYEERKEVRAGETTDLTFTADIHGVFEIELERSHRRLTTLEVQT